MYTYIDVYIYIYIYIYFRALFLLFLPLIALLIFERLGLVSLAALIPS